MPFTVLIIGVSGLVVQILLLRELLVVFNGNELTIGIILGNWILLEAFGAFVAGYAVKKRSNPADLFLSLQLLFSLTLPIVLYLSRTFKTLIGVPFGEGIGLTAIFATSFLIQLPVSFSHGALFTVAARIHSADKNSNQTGNIYTLETIGTIIGGIFLTYCFIPYFTPYQSAFFLIFLIICSNLNFRKNLAPKMLFTCVVFICVFTMSLILGLPRKLEMISTQMQWRGAPGKLLDYSHSRYGTIAVTKNKEQYTFFHNGQPVITTPNPDNSFIQEFGNLPLLFHPHPDSICVVGSGAGGLLNEILKHPITQAVYVELDPGLIKMVQKYPTALTQKELTDPRVITKYTDARLYLGTTRESFDVIIIGLSSLSELSQHRLFSLEFFNLARTKLKNNGIIALSLPGSSVYYSEELKNLNSSIFYALKIAYKYVRVITGDFNTYIASPTLDVERMDSKYIIKNMEDRKIKTDILVPDYITYKFGLPLNVWFKLPKEQIRSQEINKDLKPLALFESLSLWNKQFGEKTQNWYFAASKRTLKFYALFIAIFTVVMLLLLRFSSKSAKMKTVFLYSIATTGFWGMCSSLLLIISYQVFHGFLYYAIGLLIALFMAGTAVGSLIAGTLLKKSALVKLFFFILLELVLVNLPFFLCGMIVTLGKTSAIFMAFLFFLCGFFPGIQFSLASQMYTPHLKNAGETAGNLYCADLMGGWLAGILTGIVFLPILGLMQTAILLALLKLSSTVIVIFHKDTIT